MVYSIRMKITPKCIVYSIRMKNQNPQLQCTKVKDQETKRHRKAYAHNRNKARPLDIKCSDKVLLQQARENKLLTMYDPKPYTVLEHKGQNLILQREGSVFIYIYEMYLMHTNCITTLLFRKVMMITRWIWMLNRQPWTRMLRGPGCPADQFVSDVHQ